MQYVNINGEVSEQTLQDVRTALANEDNEITLLINSLGGSLSVGLEIFDLLSTCPKEKHTIYARCSGNVASSATLILCGVSKERRSATKNTCFLIHQPLLSMYGTQNLGEIRQLKDSMETANNQIKDIYRLRTDLDDSLMESLMQSETEFYADKALEYGLIGSIEQLQNKKTKQGSNYNKKITRIRTMKKSFLNTLVEGVISRLLKNEAYLTTDGQEIDIDAIEIGANAGCPDGVYELAEDGTVVTIEGGVVKDIVKKDAEPAQEEPEVKNEGEEAGEQTPAEDKTVEEGKDALKEVEQVAEEAKTAETPEEVAEIAQQVEEIVKEQFQEVIDKYKNLKNLVDNCGGEARLKSLANVKHEQKAFVAENKAEKGKRSVAELVAMKRK